MKFGDVRQSRFLKQKDVEQPTLVTVVKVEEMNVALPGAEPEYKGCLWFRELEKPMTLNATNASILMGIFGLTEDDDVSKLIGKRIVLYCDPNIMYGGKAVGGIRIRAVKDGYQAPVPPPQAPQTDNVPF